MKTIVVYKSKYGTTKRYATWIAKRLDCPLVKLSDISIKELVVCDTIIYGGGIYAGSVSGFKKFLSLLGEPKDKNLILCMVGITNPEQKDVYDKIAATNVPEVWRNQCEAFSLRGDQLFSKMSGIHKLIMRIPMSAARKKSPEERTDDERKAIENFGKDVVYSSEDNIESLINYIKGL